MLNPFLSVFCTIQRREKSQMSILFKHFIRLSIQIKHFYPRPFQKTLSIFAQASTP